MGRCFNMGCVHLLAGHPEAALQAFDQAVTKDTCMAVGFFQQGVANFQLDRCCSTWQQCSASWGSGPRPPTASRKPSPWGQKGPTTAWMLPRTTCRYSAWNKSPDRSLQGCWQLRTPWGLGYRDPGDNGRWVPLSGEEPLQRAWWDSAAEPEGLWLPCWGVAGRPVLYQVVAQHSYSA
ncbi:NADPH oxidase activator 1 [Manis javanica]|nr:NADPH oxidase activator 1 [Manis javanica]